MSPARRKKLVRFYLVLGSLVAVLLVAEATLRFLLFAPAARALGIGWRVRNESLYTAREAGRETWKLRALVEEHGPAPRAPAFDARFGWLSDGIDPASLASADEASLDGRRPVLLFGDSFAQCVREAGVCWQDLLEASALSDRFRLLNYGVAGYGLDQVRLLMEPVLERFRDRDPIVVIGILVDDGLDRSYLPLRQHPKPYFTLENASLVLHPVEQDDATAYLDAHPLRIRSYLWRWLLFGSGLVPRDAALAWTDESDHVAVKQGVNRRLLRDMRRILEERGTSYFVLLFHGRRALEAGDSFGWQEPFLLRSLAQLRIPCLPTRWFLQADLDETGGTLDDLYLPLGGGGANHYTERANRVVFHALLAGLEGRFVAPLLLADG